MGDDAKQIGDRIMESVMADVRNVDAANKAGLDGPLKQLSGKVPFAIAWTVSVLATKRRHFALDEYATQAQFPQHEFVARWICEGLLRDGKAILALESQRGPRSDATTYIDAKIDGAFARNLGVAEELAKQLGAKHRVRVNVTALSRPSLGDLAAEERRREPSLAERARERRARLRVKADAK